MNDERKPDYHGPATTDHPEYWQHRRVYDVGADLLNGRVTNAGARKELRKALDVADKEAPKGSPIVGKL